MDKEVALLKVLSEPMRLRLAVLLAAEGEVCVCRLAAAMAAPEYKISRHLGVMRAAGLVEARREGTWMYYQLAAPGCAMQTHLVEFFRHGFEHNTRVLADRKQLRKTGCGK